MHVFISYILLTSVYKEHNKRRFQYHSKNDIHTFSNLFNLHDNNFLLDDDKTSSSYKMSERLTRKKQSLLD